MEELAAGWDEDAGRVTRAFDEWRFAIEDIRAFMHLAGVWGRKGYEAAREEAKADFQRDFDPDRNDPSEQINYFDRGVSGLWPVGYDWMLHAAVVKDAVSAYEVYLEKAGAEALGRWSHDGQRLTWKLGKSDESPRWPALVAVHDVLGSDVADEKVAQVRALRHLLTHQRGEFRTAEQRARFQQEESQTGPTLASLAVDVELPRGVVAQVLETLVNSARQADPRAWKVAYAGRQLPEAMVHLAEGKKAVLTWVPGS